MYEEQPTNYSDVVLIVAILESESSIAVVSMKEVVQYREKSMYSVTSCNRFFLHQCIQALVVTAIQVAIAIEVVQTIKCILYI